MELRYLVFAKFYSHSPQAGVEERGFCGVVDSVKMVGRDTSTTFLS